MRHFIILLALSLAVTSNVFAYPSAVSENDIPNNPVSVGFISWDNVNQRFRIGTLTEQSAAMTITALASTDIPLLVRAASGLSVPYLTFENSSGVDVLVLTSGGTLQANVLTANFNNTAVSLSATFKQTVEFDSGTAADVAVQIENRSGQTEALMNIQDFNNVVMRQWDESGADVIVPLALTIDDDGAGTAAAGTLTPTSSYAEVTCSDANGCTLAISETGARQGQQIEILNISANTLTINDTSGQQETTAPALGQYDTFSGRYMSDRWVQYATSNN